MSEGTLYPKVHYVRRYIISEVTLYMKVRYIRRYVISEGTFIDEVRYSRVCCNGMILYSILQCTFSISVFVFKFWLIS